MRRRDKQITDRALIDTIIYKATVCRLALASEKRPYLIPVAFGYDGNSLFFHTAMSGKKIDYFFDNNLVCFEFENNVRLHKDENIACNWTFEYESVIGYGEIQELLTENDKIVALNQIMRQYSGQTWPINAQDLASTRLWQIKINSISAKKSVIKPDQDLPD